MPWVAGGVVPATQGKNRATAVAQRRGGDMRRWGVAERIQEWEVGDKGCVMSVHNSISRLRRFQSQQHDQERTHPIGTVHVGVFGRGPVFPVGLVVGDAVEPLEAEEWPAIRPARSQGLGETAARAPDRRARFGPSDRLSGQNPRCASARNTEWPCRWAGRSGCGRAGG